MSTMLAARNGLAAFSIGSLWLGARMYEQSDQDMTIVQGISSAVAYSFVVIASVLIAIVTSIATADEKSRPSPAGRGGSWALAGAWGLGVSLIVLGIDAAFLRTKAQTADGINAIAAGAGAGAAAWFLS